MSVSRTSVFHRRATVTRFLRCAEPQEAELLALQHLNTTAGTVDVPLSRIISCAVHSPHAEVYHHAGEEEMWRVTVEVDVTVSARGPQEATEATHLFIEVTTNNPGVEVFEPEVHVGEIPDPPGRCAA